MFQGSVSSSWPIKQATAAAVQTKRKQCGFRVSSQSPLDHAAGLYSSLGSPSTVSLRDKRKHIHFNEQVSQCIVINIKSDEDDGYISENRHAHNGDSDGCSSMTKRTITDAGHPILKKRKEKSSNKSDAGKTIAMLPPTSLLRSGPEMFISYEKGDLGNNGGMLRRVIDTVNTTREIAQLIRNVDWKR